MTKATEWMCFPNDFVCDCGMKMKSYPNIAHLRGIVHQQAERINGLIKNECIRFSEIGRRLGLTRERVRQIAEQLGLSTGNQRQAVCTIRRTRKKFLQSLPSQLDELRQIAKKYAIDFEPVLGCSGEMVFRHRRVKMNGFLCHVARMSHHPLDYVVIRNPYVKDYDFFLGRGIDGWAVIPRTQMPKGSTLAVMGRPKILPGADSHRSYEQFHEAWHLLKQNHPPKGSPDANRY